MAVASGQSNFKRLNFEVGGGLGIGKGAVGKFVGGSYHGVAGGGLNRSRMIGFDGEYMYYGLPLKKSVIQNQFLLPGATGHVQSVTLNGIVTAPLQGRWGAYGIGGVGWYQRSVSNRSEFLAAGTPCQPAWIWWDLTCVNGVISPAQTLTSRTKDAGGFNFGGGVTYRLHHPHAKLYLEGRYHRAYHSDVQTTFIPVTVGLRW